MWKFFSNVGLNPDVGDKLHRFVLVCSVLRGRDGEFGSCAETVWTTGIFQLENIGKCSSAIPRAPIIGVMFGHRTNHSGESGCGFIQSPIGAGSDADQLTSQDGGRCRLSAGHVWDWRLTTGDCRAPHRKPLAARAHSIMQTSISSRFSETQRGRRWPAERPGRIHCVSSFRSPMLDGALPIFIGG